MHCIPSTLPQLLILFLFDSRSTILYSTPTPIPSYTSLTPRRGISASTISNPLKLGYRLLNASTSHSSPSPAGRVFVGLPEPPVCRFFGLGGARGGGPDGARRLIAGGAEAEGTGGGRLGLTDEGFAYVRSCCVTGLRAMAGGGWRAGMPD